MVRIQLVEVNEGYLDVEEQSVVPLNFSVSEIRDLSKKKGAFSKTITLAGTQNNNQLLNNYFEVNVVSGAFNVAKKQPCLIIENGVTILDNCILQLLNVKVTGKLVSYEVTIKDTSSDFFNTINGRELTDLDFTDLNHVVNAANVITSFGHTSADGYKYGIGNNETTTYNINQLMPCVYVKTIWDRLFQSAGFTYDFDEITTIGFDKLLLPYVSDGVKLTDNSVDLAEAEISTPFTTITDSINVGSINNFTEQFIADVEVSDVGNHYNPTLGRYGIPFNLQGSDALSVNINCNYDVSLETSAGTVTLIGGNRTLKPTIAPEKGGQYFFMNGAEIVIPSGFTFTTSTLLTTGNISQTISINNCLVGEFIKTFVGIQNVTGSTSIFQNGGNPEQVNVRVKILDLEVTFVPTLASIAENATVNANSLIPTKVKQSDFLKSICQMFNLFISTDKFNARNLIIKTRDKYYDDGVAKDWTLKIAKDRESQLSFLSDVSSKKYLLTYKEDKDQYNDIYLKATNERYGQVEFTFDSDFVKDTQTNELIFSPTPVLKTNFGAVVPAINYPAPKLNLRILYDGGNFSCGEYTINGTSTTTYPLITHFNDPLLPTYDINFSVCDFYYIQGLGLTNNNLYNLYWRRTLGQINKGKLLNALFYLNEVDINTLDLSDKIYIGNTVWNINKIVDYDANSKELTRVELISVDEESSFTPYITNDPANIPPSTVNIVPIENSNAGGGIMQGSGNNQGTTGVTIGNVNNNQGGGVIVGRNNTVLSPAIVLGNNNVVQPNINNVLIVGDNTNATQSNTIYVDGVPLSLVGSLFWTQTTAGATYSFYNTGKGHVLDILSLNSGIVGGVSNTIDQSNESYILGGISNTIENGSTNSQILGGAFNVVNNVDYAILLGVVNLQALYDSTTYQNNSYRQTVDTVTTTNNTVTTLKSFLPINGVYNVEASVTGFEVATGDAIGVNMFASFKVIAGVVTQISTTTRDRKSNFPASVTSDIETDGINIRVRVTGRTGSTIEWKSTINIIK